MIGLQIEDPKIFMNHLFKEETFDHFEVVSIQLKTMVYYDIDGLNNKDYYDTDDQLNLPLYFNWSFYKSNIAALIKGKRPPLFFKIVLSLSKEQVGRILEKTDLTEEFIQGFFINIQYDHPTLKMMTGTNYKSFTLDKSAEAYFDQSIKKFLVKQQINYTE